VAFLSNAPGDALEICREAGRLTSQSVPAECDEGGPDGIALSLARISGTADAVEIPKFSALLGIVLLATAISLLVSYLIIRSEPLHGRFSDDLAAAGPQKFHAVATTRIGGVAIACGLAGSVLALHVLEWINPVSAYGLTMWPFPPFRHSPEGSEKTSPRRSA
jgi:hypothetical protein